MAKGKGPLKTAIKHDLFAAQSHLEQLNKIGDPLVDIDEFVDFSALSKAIDATLARPELAKGGRPRYPTEIKMGEQGVQSLFEAIDAQIAQAGYTAKGGQIIHATLIKAPIQRNPRKENEMIKQGKTPDDWHKNKLIRCYVTDTASPHDSKKCKIPHKSQFSRKK